LSPLASSEIAEAADANLVAHASYPARALPGSRVVESPSLSVIDSGIPNDTFNIVCRARMTVPEAPRRIQATLADFRGVGRPFSWWLGPADRPAELPAMLREGGLAAAETEIAMSRGLSRPAPASAGPRGLLIRSVASRRQLQDFARLLGANEPEVLRFYDLAAEALLSSESPLHFFVGYLGGVPVATAELTITGAVVGLYNISTVPEHRRHGIGTAMTMAALREAGERGCATAILQAAADGVGIYEDVGFREFGRITEFKPPGRGRGAT
jgi:ribosomal protein S18 acetylase RimI-like enzyme